MRKYECMMIIDPTLGDDIRNELLTEIKTEFKTHGTTVVTEDLQGVKHLAYKIRASSDGYYILYILESDGTGLLEVTKFLNLKKQVWRHMFVRIED